MPIRSLLRATGTAISAFLVTPLVFVSVADAHQTSSNGLIAYDQFRAGDPGSQIWTVDPATGIETDLSGTHYGDANPAFAPNGNRIAFQRAGQIWTMTVTGQKRRSLTPNANTYSAPAWSPDGRKIVYVDNNGLAIMNSDGSNQHVILSGNTDIEPAWSPDGKTIAFASYRADQTKQIFSIRPNGSHLKDLSNNSSVIDQTPVWSPDSTHLIFDSNRNPSRYEVFMMTSRGGSVHEISSSPPSGSYDPAYSPDGTQFAYASNYMGSVEVWVQSISGGQRVRVTSEPDNSQDQHLSWQPVG